MRLNTYTRLYVALFVAFVQQILLTITRLYDRMIKKHRVDTCINGMEYLMYNENAKNRTMRYMKESRDKLTLNLPKGKKDEYKEYAQFKGMSLTELIMKLIEADMSENQEEYSVFKNPF